MYFHEQTYDLDELSRQNLHIHTSFSGCAKPEMVLCDIIKTAENCGLKTIALVDHIQAGEEEKLKAQLVQLKKQLCECKTDIKVLIGAELSAYGVDKFSFHDEDYPLDYRLYAHNHYHVDGWEQPEDKTVDGYRKHMIDTLTALIKADKADCLAHPFNDGYLVKHVEGELHNRFNAVTDSFSDEEIGDLLELGKAHEVAFELNFCAIPGYPNFCRRYFALGKEIGVHFNIGTDAHKLCDIDTKQYLDKIKSILI